MQARLAQMEEEKHAVGLVTMVLLVLCSNLGPRSSPSLIKRPLHQTPSPTVPARKETRAWRMSSPRRWTQGAYTLAT
jgi:hypothetical protein